MSSESDQSDEDFVPGVQEVVSEDDSAEEETDLQYEKEVAIKDIKRKSKTLPKTRQKRVRLNTEQDQPSSDEEDKVISVALKPEEAKKKEEDLWAQFLGDDSSKAKQSNGIQNKTDVVEIPESFKETTGRHLVKPVDQKENEQKSRIFEFAGETVLVDDNATVPLPSFSGTSKPAPENIAKPKPGRGLSALMNKIGKKNKLSVLEKSQLDWKNFKKDKGIEEELQTFNRGKDGYLERQDFLERADHRQFEIEKSLRVKKSNR